MYRWLVTNSCTNVQGGTQQMFRAEHSKCSGRNTANSLHSAQYLYQTTWRHIPEVTVFHRHSRQQPKHTLCSEGTKYSACWLRQHTDSVKVRGYSKWLPGFQQLVIHNKLEIVVCSYTDGSRNSQSFLLWCAVCSSCAFLRLERSLLRWRRTAIETITADTLQTVWSELDYRVDFCRITNGAHIEHL